MQFTFVCWKPCAPDGDGHPVKEDVERICVLIATSSLKVLWEVVKNTLNVIHGSARFWHSTWERLSKNIMWFWIVGVWVMSHNKMKICNKFFITPSQFTWIRHRSAQFHHNSNHNFIQIIYHFAQAAIKTKSSQIFNLFFIQPTASPFSVPHIKKKFCFGMLTTHNHIFVFKWMTYFQCMFIFLTEIGQICYILSPAYALWMTGTSERSHML